MLEQKWLLYALGSAVAAALVGVFGKVGMEGVNATAGSAVRSIIMTLFLLGVCLVTQTSLRLGEFSKRAVAAIILSGVAGAVSWMFYFRAVQVGRVSQVAPIDKLSMPLAVLLAVILLGERPSGINWAGVALMAAGAYLTAWPKS